MYGNEGGAMKAERYYMDAPATGRPERMPEVGMQMEEIAGALKRLEQVADQLCQRLSPVQRSVPPAVGTDKAAHVVVQAPLADQLRGYAATISRLGYMLDDNRERLEI